MSRWDQYLLWNQAVQEAVFNEEVAGSPVYLDLEEEVLSRLAEHTGTETNAVEEQLGRAVGSVLTPGGTSLFQPLERKRITWQMRARYLQSGDSQSEEDLPAPPILALLTLFSLAAERMGIDSSFAPNAYYPRLFQLMQVPNTAQHQQSYRKIAEPAWESLNYWLAACGGRFGLPTAYALGHRYVGLPLSQALVRAADRDKFPGFFQLAGLSPGTDLTAGDMERMLNPWVTSHPAPLSAGLTQLWRRQSARSRIAEVACTELLNWNGQIPVPAVANRHVQVRAPMPRLTLRRKRFPRPGLEFSFLVPISEPASLDSLTLLADDQETPIGLQPLTSGQSQPIWDQRVEPTSLIGGVLVLHDTNSNSFLERRPRQIVPMRRDELMNLFIEEERLQLGERSVVLVRDHEDLVSRVRSTLADCARPGFKEQAPAEIDDWVLFTDIQIISPPQEELPTDLNMLQPNVESKLTLSGGVRIPGRIRRWSTLAPPEIAVVSQQESDIVVDIKKVEFSTDSRRNSQHEWKRTETTHGFSLIIQTDLYDLNDGDYRITLKINGKIAQESTLRLRSADTPDVINWRSSVKVRYLSEDPQFAITGTVWDDQAGTAVSGTHVEPHPERYLVADISAPDRASWGEPPGKRRSLPIAIPTPSQDSCFFTGHHHYIIPPMYDLDDVPRFMEGECENCHHVRRIPTSLRRRKAGQPTQDLDRVFASHPVPPPLPPVPDDTRRYEIAMDVLKYLRSGSGTDLTSVASEVGGSELFNYQFSQGLEASANVDVVRDCSGKVTNWEHTQPAIVQIGTGELLLVGNWRSTWSDRIGELTTDLGGTIHHSEYRYFSPTRLRSVSLDDLERKVRTEEFGNSVGFIADAAYSLATILPSLNVVAQRLPRSPLPSASSITKFDLDTASWRPVTHANLPGAYRIRLSYRTINVFRTEQDVENGVAAQSQVELVKHLAANQAGRLLMAYHEPTQRLAVPLGAGMIGLYARTLYLLSGRLPVPKPNLRSILYPNVPRDIADHMAGLFSKGLA